MEISLRERGIESVRASSPEALPNRHGLAIPPNSTRSADGILRAQAGKSAALADRVLIGRFNGGDEGAFVEIVARHRDRLHSLALGFLRNHADAEEIVQDTLIRAHRGLAQFRNESSLATWLHRIAINLARNRYWYFFRRRRHLTLPLDSPLGPDSSGTVGDLVAAPASDPARQVTADEFVAIVASSMEKLEPAHREILNLRNWLHHTYEEIARALGVNEGTVKSRIARARGRLRQVIAEDHPELAANQTTSDWFERRPDCGQRQLAA